VHYREDEDGDMECRISTTTLRLLAWKIGQL